LFLGEVLLAPATDEGATAGAAAFLFGDALVGAPAAGAESCFLTGMAAPAFRFFSTTSWCCCSAAMRSNSSLSFLVRLFQALVDDDVDLDRSDESEGEEEWDYSQQAGQTVREGREVGKGDEAAWHTSRLRPRGGAMVRPNMDDRDMVARSGGGKRVMRLQRASGRGREWLRRIEENTFGSAFHTRRDASVAGRVKCGERLKPERLLRL
jgi:hypothetical protein